MSNLLQVLKLPLTVNAHRFPSQPTTTATTMFRFLGRGRPQAFENPQNNCPLMRLPPEIRNMIYHHALIKDEEGIGDGDPDYHRVDLRDLPCLALTATCRWIEREALPYYFRHEKFRYTIYVNLDRIVLDLFYRETERWLKAGGAGNLLVHDVVFIIGLPDPQGKLYVPSSQRTEWGGIKVLSVVGRSKPRVVLGPQQQRQPGHSARQGRWKVWLQRVLFDEIGWARIDRCAEGGLRVRKAEDVAFWIMVMARLWSWLGWGLVWLVAGTSIQKEDAQQLAVDTWDWCVEACEIREEMEERLRQRVKR